MLGDLAQGGFLGGAEGGDPGGAADRLAQRGRPADRRSREAAGGEAGIVIGTHALLEEHVQFADLGLVVVDEQHRFGVEQRAALNAKAGAPPHVLVMTATPIPRTVAMTVFGDLDTSTLASCRRDGARCRRPSCRPLAQPGWLDRAWERVREEVAAGSPGLRRVRADRPGRGQRRPARAPGRCAPSRSSHPQLAAVELAGLRVEMLHGRMAPEEKDRVMQAFAAGEVEVLVSTTVIEVGVDVPNATVMVILDADRFGVSQLHQLRGRIGRGGHAGLCLLVSAADPASTSMERLVAVAATRDGFELSRIDLEQRREGNVLGIEQSGGAVRAQAALGAARRGRHRARPRRGDGTPRRRPGPGRQPGAGGGRSPARGVRAGRVPGDDMTPHPREVRRDPHHRRHRRRATPQDPDRRGHPAHLRPGPRGAVLRAGVPSSAR